MVFLIIGKAFGIIDKENQFEEIYTETMKMAETAVYGFKKLCAGKEVFDVLCGDLQNRVQDVSKEIDFYKTSIDSFLNTPEADGPAKFSENHKLAKSILEWKKSLDPCLRLVNNSFDFCNKSVKFFLDMSCVVEKVKTLNEEFKPNSQMIDYLNEMKKLYQEENLAQHCEELKINMEKASCGINKYQEKARAFTKISVSLYFAKFVKLVVQFGVSCFNCTVILL